MQRLLENTRTYTLALLLGLALLAQAASWTPPQSATPHNAAAPAPAAACPGEGEADVCL